MLRLRLEFGAAFELLAALRRHLEGPGELLGAAVPVAAGAMERNFDEEGRPTPWPPLASATLRQKPAGLKILERSGRLRRSIATRVEGNAIVASTDVPYAAAHQFGAPRRRLPARPFLVLTPEDAEAVASAVADGLENDNSDAGKPSGAKAHDF
jgi:phage virion morphogenesis protein